MLLELWFKMLNKLDGYLLNVGCAFSWLESYYYNCVPFVVTLTPNQGRILNFDHCSSSTCVWLAANKTFALLQLTVALCRMLRYSASIVLIFIAIFRTSSSSSSCLASIAFFEICWYVDDSVALSLINLFLKAYYVVLPVSLLKQPPQYTRNPCILSTWYRIWMV